MLNEYLYIWYRQGDNFTSNFLDKLIFMKKTLSDAYKSLKTKQKFSWVIPKVVTDTYGSSCLRELFITKFM